MRTTPAAPLFTLDHVRDGSPDHLPCSTGQQIAEEFGVTRPTVYRHLGKQPAPAATEAGT